MRPSAVLAIAIALVTAIANAATLLFLDFFGPFIVLPFALGTTAAIGLVVALRRPRHAVGWLFQFCGGCFALWFLLFAYAWRAVADAPGTLPAGEISAWLYSMLWVPAVGAFMVALMLFPTGRPASRRWAPVVAAVIAAFAVALLSAAVRPSIMISSPAAGGLEASTSGSTTVLNPFGTWGRFGEALRTAEPFITAALGLPLLLIVLAAIAHRYARSSGVERLQLKWFVYASSLAVTILSVSFLGPTAVIRTLGSVGGMVALGLIPVAAGSAILRYRLYDIDIVINRTLVYGAVTVMLAATYFAGVVVLQALLRPFTTGNELAVAGSTLLVVALFQPVRRRVQDAVDRRFYRSRYDAARTLDAFGARLRDEVDLDSVRADLLETVGTTLRPAHASVWIRERRG